MATLKIVSIFIFALVTFFSYGRQAHGSLSADTRKLIHRARAHGPYLGLVIPNLFEMNPLLQSPNFTSTFNIDFSGVTTQLLLTIFDVRGVIHYGIAGNANPSLNIGDVTIPQYWAHTGLWNWQRYGQGPEDELSLESNGDYTRSIGFNKFANYTVNVTGCGSYDNLLNNVWYQPEEIFPVNATPEKREHAFWVSVDPSYYEISKQLEKLKLGSCVNATTCLSKTPSVVNVQRGSSAGIYLDNAAYRNFLYQKFNVSPVDMESSSVALICLQQQTPFIAIRALSDLAGGGSAQSNEAATFTSLAANNSVLVVLEFIKRLPSMNKRAR